ncbi:PP2C family protein-serine/threonine phosphatase [Saccharothrix sp. Mg75]|uniref:PP2C family protein-serine/threonine phosphatase n=1 Tax=Saccharothrix sp. Mg75 TaxID=3445357 RepID=UPI003EE93604
MTDQHAERQRQSTVAALRHAELTVEALWLRYFSLGGNAGPIDVDAYLHGLGTLPRLQRDVLAHVVNERLDELVPPDRATYSNLVDGVPPAPVEGEPVQDELVSLLEGAELAPPDRLPALVEAAGRVLGVRITAYLVDYPQRRLHPWGPAPGDRTPLGLDTPAGTAFRETRIVPAPDRPALWVPLLDGVERLGVLDVEAEGPVDLDDPRLRSRCRWLAMLLGHLITLLDQYGDAADRVRLPSPRTVAGELVWSLLPPSTAGVNGFVVSGAVDPADPGGVFDYALSETTATLLVLDATGQGERGGLVAATALAAHRSARYAGRDLAGQARAMDEAISGHCGAGASASALLVEVDLVTGRLRHLDAGAARSVVVRVDGTVEPLASGDAPPLGKGAGEPATGQAVLGSEDWLVLRPGGFGDARTDPADHARLADFLRRETTSGHSPAETVRELLGTALGHDGALLLARWTDRGTMLP